jgi:hypothetical protein
VIEGARHLLNEWVLCTMRSQLGTDCRRFGGACRRHQQASQLRADQDWIYSLAPSILQTTNGSTSLSCGQIAFHEQANEIVCQWAAAVQQLSRAARLDDIARLEQEVALQKVDQVRSLLVPPTHPGANGKRVGGSVGSQNSQGVFDGDRATQNAVEECHEQRTDTVFGVWDAALEKRERQLDRLSLCFVQMDSQRLVIDIGTGRLCRLPFDTVPRKVGGSCLCGERRLSEPHAHQMPSEVQVRKQ